jgi:23S rRNA pseudouridine2605 synthase
MIRLNKFLAQAGIASRRKSDDLILAGHIKVNGEIVNHVGVVIDEEKDVVEFKGKVVSLKKDFIYVVLNKPEEVISSTKDEFRRQTVVGMVSFPERIYPIGRLDYDTSGVLLLTNDGELTNRLLHPSYKVTKIYRVLINRIIKPVDLHHLQQGVMLEDQMTQPCKIREIRKMGDQSYLEIEIKEGRNRQIRKMFALFKYHVEELERISFAGITAQGLRKGEWRYLSQSEVSMLKKEVNYEN